jgi:hypothetical protein
MLATHLEVLVHTSSLAEACSEEVAGWHCQVILQCCQHLLLHAEDVLPAGTEATLVWVRSGIVQEKYKVDVPVVLEQLPVLSCTHRV